MTVQRLLRLGRTWSAWMKGRARRGRAPAGSDGWRRFRQAVSAWAEAMRWQGARAAPRFVPPERTDPVPVDYPLTAGWTSLARAASATARYLAAPFGSYVALTVADTALRAAEIRGSRVRRWAEVDLAPGTVRDGLIVDSQSFAERAAALAEALRPGSKLKDRRVALTLTGRNMVHGRFAVHAPDEDQLAEAVLEAARERLGVRAGELQMDWHATRLPRTAGQPERAADEEQPGAEPEPAPTHDVYAVGLYRNVVEANLRQIVGLGAQVIDLQPRALALTSAADEPDAIVIDVEPHAASVVVVTAGLPEVVRDIVLEPGLPAERSAALIRDELERCVGFHNSLFPDDPLPEETPLFVTGQDGAVGRLEAALEGLEFDRWNLPPVLRAPAAFPMARFAAAVGLASMNARRPLWPRPARRIERPRLRFLPPAYRPRQVPVRLVFAGAAAAVLILGLGALYTSARGRLSAAEEQRYAADVLEKRVQMRVAELREAARTQAAIDTTSALAQTALRTATAIRGIDRGFAMTLSEVTRHRVDGVVLQEIDDDGALVTVRATAASYEALLTYVRALEDSGAFGRVAIRTIGDAFGGRTPAGTARLPGMDLPGPSLTLELTRAGAAASGRPGEGTLAGQQVRASSPAR